MRRERRESQQSQSQRIQDTEYRTQYKLQKKDPWAKITKPLLLMAASKTISRMERGMGSGWDEEEINESDCYFISLVRRICRNPQEQKERALVRSMFLYW